MTAENDDLAVAGLWIAVAELARQKNITRQSAHERVDRLEAAGKITVRREGGLKLINLAEYDVAVGEVGDAAKEAGAETKAELDAPEAPAAPDRPVFRDHQTREKQYAADLKLIELQKELGRLVPVDQVSDAAIKAAEVAVAVVERLPSYAEAIAAAAAKDGTNGTRAKLKEITREIRQGIADAMAKLAGSVAPQTLAAVEENETAD